ncbi:MAG: Threonine-tRNA ligase [Candidatus Amesbacteria bacterium GW2011_GWA2_47_11]|nr:MAG: Threonine-tRNA ligase [Candidatus Amesbacteria bacterium GW2011_GWA2_47_11]
MIYKSKMRSYRDLPLKLAEYGTVARYEDSGSLNGILRPRLFCQNDAHVYCTEDQAVDVFVEIIRLHQYYYDALGLKDYYIVLCLRDPAKKDKYHGEEELWQKSESLSRAAMDKAGVKYVVEDEGAAHYGPKMDFKIKSAIGTEYGISTNQIDLFMPRRFDLKYTDRDGSQKYVIVQHRAPLGSSERFVGFLLEHFAGAFPVWLAPVQSAVLPITDKHLDYAQKVHQVLKDAGIRSELDARNEPLSARVRDWELQKVPYILAVGDREAQDNSVSVRKRGIAKTFSQSMPQFSASVIKEIATRSLA